MTSYPNSPELDEAIADYMRRIDAGESVDVESFIGQHASVADALRSYFAQEDELREAFHGADTIDVQHTPTRRGVLRIRCPHCHAPQDVSTDSCLEDIRCPECRSSFSLTMTGEETRDAETVSTIGHFELIGLLGGGSFGEVWKARDTKLDRTVAIKIPRRVRMDEAEIAKFFREARAAAQLSHPNIVSVHEVGREGDQAYIVSDIVRGVTLDEWLSAQKATGFEVARWCAKIAAALHHAHEQGVIHRDLKPANIIIDGAGEPHLMDFGLARREAGEVTVTMDGHVLGTPAYMSPEQAAGRSHTADRRTDIYSLGVILFKLLTGELPFRGSARMLMHQVLYDEAPSPRQLNGYIAKDLETITLKCMEKEPSKRYSTAKEVAEELQRFLGGHQINARPAGLVRKFWKFTKRNWPAVSLVATVFVVTVLSLLVVSNELMRRIEAQKRWVNLQIDALLKAPTESLPDYMTSLAEFANYSRERLREEYRSGSLSDSQRIKIALARLQLNEGRSTSDERLLDDTLQLAIAASPADVRAICDALIRLQLTPAQLSSLPQLEAHREELSEADRSSLARRQANAAIVRARLGDRASLWRLLRGSNDNSPRSYVIANWASSGGTTTPLVERLGIVRDKSVLRALLLCLASLPRESIPTADFEAIHAQILSFFETHPDPGVHAASRWVLMQWGLESDVRDVEARLSNVGTGEQLEKPWFIDSAGNTMLVFGPAEFHMGSASVEVNPHENPESQHLRKIDWRFAIAMLETTVGQFSTRIGTRPPNSVNDGNPENPVNAITWLEAASYCNRLSSCEGIPIGQWCYLLDETSGQLREVDNAWQRRGYRLPTEAEWEFSCRAGTTTPRFFGYADELLPEYAWCLRNSPDAYQHPVGNRNPNDFGLFDMYGNTIEWCHDWFKLYPGDRTKSKPPVAKVLRGSAVGDPTGFRSALRDMAPVNTGSLASGFRVCRTIRASDEVKE